MKRNKEKDRIISTMDIVRKFNISYQTVNYYTNLGLLNTKRRIGRGNGRQYIEEEVRKRLHKIQRFKDVGYPLRIIARMINNKV